MATNRKKVGNYELIQELGRGAFGTVWKAENSVTKEIFAIKVIDKAKLQQSVMNQKLFEREIEVLKKMNSPHVLMVYEVLSTQNNMYVICNYCDGGDLQQYIGRKNPDGLDEQQATTFLMQIMNGFKHLHEHHIMHRDFKPANIFIHQGNLIIGDLGFAKSFNEGGTTYLGSPITMAPEILELRRINSQMLPKKYSSKVDLWSIGVVYYFMLFGHYPFNGNNEMEIYNKIQTNSGQNLNFGKETKSVSDSCKDLLRRLLEKDAKYRIDWQKFFNHEIFIQNLGLLDKPMRQLFESNQTSTVGETMVEMDKTLQDSPEPGINEVDPTIQLNQPCLSAQHNSESNLMYKGQFYTSIEPPRTNSTSSSFTKKSIPVQISQKPSDPANCTEESPGVQVLRSEKLPAQSSSIRLTQDNLDQTSMMYLESLVFATKSLVSYTTFLARESFESIQNETNSINPSLKLRVMVALTLALKKAERQLRLGIFQATSLRNNSKDSNYKIISSYISELKELETDLQDDLNELVGHIESESPFEDSFKFMKYTILNNPLCTPEAVDSELKETIKHLLEESLQIRSMEPKASKFIEKTICFTHNVLYFKHALSFGAIDDRTFDWVGDLKNLEKSLFRDERLRNIFSHLN